MEPMGNSVMRGCGPWKVTNLMVDTAGIAGELDERQSAAMRGADFGNWAQGQDDDEIEIRRREIRKGLPEPYARCDELACFWSKR